MNTLVSFELAKLLIQKEYDLHPDFKDSYPTIAEVVMWIYEKYGIWISVDKNKEEKFRVIICPKGRSLFIKGITDGKIEYTKIQWYDSPTEAYEAAIEYCLNNLV